MRGLGSVFGGTDLGEAERSVSRAVGRLVGRSIGDWVVGRSVSR